MNRSVMLALAMAIVGTGVAFAQQPVQPRPQVTRSYRSYSVAPAPRGTAAPRSRAASDATWRHAEAKPAGQFHGGR